jgi:phage/plasmid primase-like uncharacterized protein
MMPASDLTDAFRAAMRQHGIEPPAAIHADGVLHRFRVGGERAGKRSGAYRLFGDGRPAGWFMSHKGGGLVKWVADAEPRRLSREEWIAYRHELAERQRQREAADAERRSRAALSAQSILEAATGDPATHPYAVAKRVPLGRLVRRGAYPPAGWKDALLVPLYTADGALVSLEAIASDGTKRFLPGGRTAGAYCPLGRLRGAERVLVAEGVATLAAAVASTGWPGAAAMSAGNLVAVARAVREQAAPGARIVVVADDDAATDGNPGVTAAWEAARAVGGAVAVPALGTGRSCDAWDLWAERGADAVREIIEAAVASAPAEARSHGGGMESSEAQDAAGNDQPVALAERRPQVQIGRGLRVDATDRVLAILRARNNLFDFGDAVAHVADGRARAVGVEWLVDHLGRVCAFYSENSKGERRQEDAPQAIARAILAKHGDRGFRRLVAVITAPTLRADGSVLDEPGHDEASGLLYDCRERDPARAPLAPTPADALAALRTLWQPFELFPFVGNVDRGVMLGALLTAALRASLPTAPGLALDAPAAGTGKTLLARCIGILATGFDPAILPPAETDDETRKRLFASLRDGHRVILWDNVREPLGGAALDSFLTAATFADRVLGASETVALPNRALFVTTGNNLRLTGDTCRRVLTARLDAKIERPYAREFDFGPDEVCSRDRAALIVAALTIVRAWITAGRPRRGEGRTASFEAWDDLVRQPLCWLAELVRASGDDALPKLTDPLHVVEATFAADPETSKLRALLHAWSGAFKTTPTTIASAIAAAEARADLRVAIDEIAGQGNGRANPRILGRWIERHVGRRVDGLRFERGRMRDGLTTWAVLQSSEPGSKNKPTEPTEPTLWRPPSAPAEPPEVGVVGLVGFQEASGPCDSAHGTHGPAGEADETDEVVL